MPIRVELASFFRLLVPHSIQDPGFDKSVVHPQQSALRLFSRWHQILFPNRSRSENPENYRQPGKDLNYGADMVSNRQHGTTD